MRRSPIISVAVLAAAAVAAPVAAAPAKLGFNEDVQPILSEYCYACHGPDKQENDLRWCVKNHPEWSDKRMADYAECAVSTVRKYRKALEQST